MTARPFDPKDVRTWPIPDHAVNTRRPDGTPWRLSSYGEGWIDGFDLALTMADRFHKTGEWS